jgi:hypothetical protein
MKSLAFHPVSRRLLGALCLSAAVLSPAGASASQPSPVQVLGKVPLAFEPNLGQADPQVRFISRGPGYNLFLTPDEAVLVLRSGGTPVPREIPVAEPRRQVVRMRAVGASPAALEGIDQQSGRSHYLQADHPERTITDVPRFGKVAARDVYPGIDVVYHGDRDHLEYDFVVAPGADPGRIRLGFEGVEGMSVDAAGDLHLRLAEGELVQPAPVLYQEIAGERRPVAGSFVLEGGQVGFRVAAYDRTQPLVIDPQILWSRLLGGSSTDFGMAVAVTPNGQAYVAGYTYSDDFPTRSGSYQPADPETGGLLDAFVTKLNLDGSQLDYSTYIGGPGSQVFLGIALDANRNAHAVGYTSGPGSLDAYAVKLNAAGSGLLYERILQGSGLDAAYSVALDGNGNAYLAGITDSTNFPKRNPLQMTLGGLFDFFVTKLNVYGATVYSTYYGTDDSELAPDLAVDGSGRAYLGGTIYDPDSEGDKLVVARLNAAGSAVEYRKELAGRGSDSLTGIAVDQYNNACVTGYTTSDNFPTTPGASQELFGGQTDGFVTKLNNSGTGYIYSTYVGGPYRETPWEIAVDDLSTVYVGGWRDSGDGTDADAWVFRLSSPGDRVLSSLRFPGMDDDQATSIALDSARNVYVTGWTYSTDFHATTGQQTLRGSTDAFVAKLAM